MKRTILVYGSIAAAIVMAATILGQVVLSKGETGAPSHSAWLGYLTLLIAFSTIFLGIRSYRDRELSGALQLPTGLRLGLGITLVASLGYVVAWEITLIATDYSFAHEYADSLVEARRQAGASDAEIAEMEAQMELFRERYANPFYRLPITFSEIFPVGLVVTLISAFLLRTPTRTATTSAS